MFDNRIILCDNVDFEEQDVPVYDCFDNIFGTFTILYDVKLYIGGAIINIKRVKYVRLIADRTYAIYTFDGDYIVFRIRG